MVNSIATSFIALSLFFSFQSLAQEEGEVVRLSTGWKNSVGIGFLTWPETAVLKSSDNKQADLKMQYLGAMLVGRTEKRWTNSGLSLRYSLGQANANISSTGTDLSYSLSGHQAASAMFGADYIRYFSRVASFGLGLHGLYYPFDLPLPQSPGLSYAINHGKNEIKGLASLYLRWQIFAGWYMDQSMMMPLSPELDTAWSVSLLRRY